MPTPPESRASVGDAASGTRRDDPFFYGWVIVGISFTTQFIGMGFVVYSFSIVLKELADEFSGGSRTPIMGLMTAMSVVAILAAPVVGRLVGRGWVRHLLTLGPFLTGLGLIAIARAQDLWELTAYYVTFLGVGGSLLMGVTATTIVVNWFDARRAMALGIAHLGASVSGVVMAPVFSALVSANGWRASYEVLGIVALCSAPVIWFLAVGRPEDRGLLPDGRLETEGSDVEALAEEPETGAMTTGEILRRPELWLISLATGLAFLAGSSLSSHLVAFETDSGVSASGAATLFSVFTGGAALGKLIFGWACDKYGERLAFSVGLFSQATGIVALIYAQGLLASVVVVFWVGIASGGTMPLSTAMLARIFGRASFGPVMGLMWPITISLQLIGPLLAAWVHDSTGSYRLAFWAFVGVSLLALVLIRMVRLEPRAQSSSPGEAPTCTSAE